MVVFELVCIFFLNESNQKPFIMCFLQVVENRCDFPHQFIVREWKTDKRGNMMIISNFGFGGKFRNNAGRRIKKQYSKNPGGKNGHRHYSFVPSFPSI